MYDLTLRAFYVFSQDDYSIIKIVIPSTRRLIVAALNGFITHHLQLTMAIQECAKLGAVRVYGAH